jgi:hypothetical protein
MKEGSMTTWQEFPAWLGRTFFGTPRRSMWTIIAIGVLVFLTSSTVRHAVLGFLGQLFGRLLLLAVLALVLRITLKGIRK